MDKVDNNETEELNEQAQIPKWLIIVTCLAFAALIALGVFLVNNYTATIPTDQNTIHNYYGTLGDYIGGIMNPLMTFITVFLLLYTVNQNHKMISISSKELKQSNKELEQTREAIWNQAKSADLKINIDLIEDVTSLFENNLEVPIKTLLFAKSMAQGGGITSRNETLLDYITKIQAENETNPETLLALKEFITTPNQEQLMTMRGINRLSNIFHISVAKVISINPDISLLYKEHIITKTLEVLSMCINTEHENNGMTYTDLEKLILRQNDNIDEVLNPENRNNRNYEHLINETPKQFKYS